MKPSQFVRYLFDLKRRIPLRDCLGYHYFADIFVVLALFADINQFIFRSIPFMGLIFETLKFLAIAAFFTTWICSRRQSIIELLVECPLAKGNVGWAVTIMYISSMAFVFNSIFYVAGGDNVISAIAYSTMIDGLMIVYLGCQYYILRKCDSILEMAAEGMMH